MIVGGIVVLFVLGARLPKRESPLKIVKPPVALVGGNSVRASIYAWASQIDRNSLVPTCCAMSHVIPKTVEFEIDPISAYQIDEH